MGDASPYLFEHRLVGGFCADDLFSEASQLPDGGWRERVSRCIDLPPIVRYVAIETFPGEIDGSLGGSGFTGAHEDELFRRVLSFDDLRAL